MVKTLAMQWGGTEYAGQAVEERGVGKGEEALPMLKEGDFEKASRLYKAKTGVGCDGFHPKVPLNLTREKTGEVVDFLEKVEQRCKWPQQACTTKNILIRKNVTREKPIALMPTLIRWWEALRALEVLNWQQKYRVDCDATDGRNGRVQPTVWEVLKNQRIEGLWRLSSWTWRRASLWSGPGRRT